MLTEVSSEMFAEASSSNEIPSAPFSVITVLKTLIRAEFLAAIPDPTGLPNIEIPFLVMTLLISERAEAPKRATPLAALPAMTILVALTTAALRSSRPLSPLLMVTPARVTLLSPTAITPPKIIVDFAPEPISLRFLVTTIGPT